MVVYIFNPSGQIRVQPVYTEPFLKMKIFECVPTTEPPDLHTHTHTHEGQSICSLHHVAPMSQTQAFMPGSKSLPTAH